MVKHLLAMQETQVRFLGHKDPLEKRMVTHSSILTWRIPWTEEPGGLQPMCHKESDTTEWLTLSLSLEDGKATKWIHPLKLQKVIQPWK